LGPTDSPQIHSACRKTVYDWETPSAERKASTDGSGLFVEQSGRNMERRQTRRIKESV